MKYLISNYIEKLSKDDINNFAIKNNINLSLEELDFTYSFIKKNYLIILNNPNEFNFSLYKDKYSEENFIKINNLIIEYRQKYNI